MAFQSVSVGAAPNDKTGDSPRAAFIKVNANFGAYGVRLAALEAVPSYVLAPASATLLGGVKANAGAAGQFVNGIASDGSLTYATPVGDGSTTWAQLSQVSFATPAASATITSLGAFHDVLIVLSDVTHNYVSTQVLNIQFSGDNGTTWTSAGQFTASVVAGVTIDGPLQIFGARNTRFACTALTAAGIGASPAGASSFGQLRTNKIVGGLTAVRIAPASGGSLNGGTITAYGR